MPYEAVTREFKFGAETGRWKGTGDIGDPRVDQFMAQQRGTLRRAAAAGRALKRSGRRAARGDRARRSCIVHSAGGPFGWVDRRRAPDLVKAIVSVEALPPAMAALQLTFDPPGELDARVGARRCRDVEWGPLGRVPRVLQADPPRRLANLSRSRSPAEQRRPVLPRSQCGLARLPAPPGVPRAGEELPRVRPRAPASPS